MAEAVRPSAADLERRPNFDFNEVEFDVSDEIPEGTILVNRYRVMSLVGGGGMGTVYLAEHLTVGRKVAIKVLNSEWSGHSFVARRFRAEARTASAIGHPGIVEVFDAGELPDKRLFLVMEYLDGHDVAHELAESATISPTRTAEILRQVASALVAAHNAGIIHRDLKPGNIMVATVQGEEIVKVLDFGIACNIAATARDGQRLTIPGSVMGTPEYMSPEQSTGAEPTARFDLYALGAIAYEMITGDPPMLAEHSFELLARKRKEPAPSLATRAPDLHPEFVRLVDDCLAIQPSRRPLDASEFIARLDTFIDDLDDEPVPYVPLGRSDSDGEIDETGDARPVTPRPAPRSPEPVAPPLPRIPTMRLTPPSPAVKRQAWLPFALVFAIVGLGVYTLLSLFDLSEEPPAEAAETAFRSDPAPPPESPRPPPKPFGVVDPPPSRPLDPVVPIPAPEIEPTPPTKAIAPTKVGVSKPQSSTEYTKPECQRIRLRADEARRTQAWSQLRDLSRKTKCWQSDSDPRKLQTMALMELKDWAGCLSAGRGLKDPEVLQWIERCRKRLQ